MIEEEKKSASEGFGITVEQVEELIEKPDLICEIDGKNYMYMSEVDSVIEVSGISFPLPDSDEEVDTLEEYIKYVKENELKTLDEVKEDYLKQTLGSTGRTPADLLGKNEKDLEKIWKSV